MSKMEPTFEEHDAELQKLLRRMDVPSKRRQDYRWLSRNLAFNNKKHPDIQKALVLVAIMMGKEEKS